MYSVAVNACHFTDTTVYTAATTITITNSLGLVCSLNREKRMMWLNCTILYADMSLNSNDDDDDDGGSGNTFPISHF